MNPLLTLALATVAVASPFTTTNQVNQRIPNSCTTLTGDTCVFPFTYKGVSYSQCTYKDSPTPWCATMLDSAGSVVTNMWGDCDSSATSGCLAEALTVPSCTTESGPRSGVPCVFPFRHLGVTYTSCTSVGQSAAWCSTSNTLAGTHIDGEYGFCPSTCPGASTTTTTTTTTSTTTTAATTTTASTTTVAGSCTPGTTFPQDCNTCVCSSSGSPVCTTLTCTTTTTPAPASSCSAVSGPASGSPCVFPFTYAGNTHTACAEWVYGGENQGKFWCSTKVDATGSHVNGEGNYGFCSLACSAPPKEGVVSGRRTQSVQPGAVVFGSNTAAASSKPRGRRPS